MGPGWCEGGKTLMTHANESQRHQVTAGETDAGERIDRVIAAHVPTLSRSRVKSLIEQGLLTRIGGEAVSEPSYRVKPGQTFAIIIPEIAPADPEPQSIPLVVIHEDPDLIVVDKPAGMVVHPAPGNADRTLVNALIAHCGNTLKGVGGVRRPGIVHRLDKDTSGLIVAAKTDRSHAGLVRQFTERSIERRYHALVWGVPVPGEGEISANIGRNPLNRKKMAVMRRGGRPATTRYRVVRAFADSSASLVECRLLTGRTHQIRVHLAASGHSILCDPLYGRTPDRRLRRLPRCARIAMKGLNRQALHASVLGFRHPDTGRWLQFESQLPPDIQRLIYSLEML